MRFPALISLLASFALFIALPVAGQVNIFGNRNPQAHHFGVQAQHAQRNWGLAGNIGLQQQLPMRDNTNLFANLNAKARNPAGNIQFTGNLEAGGPLGGKPSVFADVGVEARKAVGGSSELYAGAGVTGRVGDKPNAFAKIGVEGGNKDVSWFADVRAEKGRGDNKVNPSVNVGVQANF